MNIHSFFLIRWVELGVERVLVTNFPTLTHLYDKGMVPQEARVVEAGHPENLHLDKVFLVGKAWELKDLVESSRKVVKIWGLYDHENSLKAQTPAQTQEEATKELLVEFKCKTLPPMWRVLEMAS